MPFYEMLPGGMPAGLQSDMDAVLNKKWGTSTTYPPEDWPETVNLMGPLPEKTVSGSIVTFSDGADAVLLKSCAVTIAPNLDGVSSVEVVKGGKNLVNIPDSAEITRNQLISTVVPLLNDFLHGKKGNFTISAKTAETVANANFITIRINYTDSTSSSNVYIYRGSTHESGGITGTFSISSDPTKTIDGVSFGGNTGAAKCAVSEWQIEANAQATAYEPYVTPTTHTAQLGRTIYGGTVDVVNGTGTDGAGKGVLNPNETWLYSSAWSKTDTNVFYTQATHDEISFATWSDNSILACDALPVGTRNEINSADTNMIGVSGNVGHPCITVRIDKTTCPDLASFIQYITNNQIPFVYKKATAEDFTFTPVPILSRLGDNTLWSDGDLSVTYRRDIDLALAQ